MTDAPNTAKAPKAKAAPKAAAAKGAPKAEKPAGPKKSPTPKNVDPRGQKRHVTGRVTSDTASAGRAKKTITVEVVRRVRDAVYGKYVKSRQRYHAHDETEQFKKHDIVEIRESRPLSATKRWVAVRLVSRPEEV